jgi:adenine specific DNA methylase Mod
LRTLLDGVFGAQRFLNEITWKRTGAHSAARRYGPVHDLLLFYSKSATYIWNPQFQANEEYLAKRYTYLDDQGRRFYPITLHALGTRRGSSGQLWRGIDITAKGGHWKYTIEKLEELDAAGDIYWPKNRHDAAA